jgi:hypothetical protein
VVGIVVLAKFTFLKGLLNKKLNNIVERRTNLQPRRVEWVSSWRRGAGGILKTGEYKSSRNPFPATNLRESPWASD